MKYVWNKYNRKKYYPFYNRDNKVYTLCESVILCVEMNNDSLVFITSDGQDLVLEEIANLSFEFQELLVAVAEENQQEEAKSSAIADELNMLRRYVEDAKLLTDMSQEPQTDRLSLGNLTRLLETIEKRSSLKINPKKHMPGAYFVFEKYEEDGIVKMKLSKYLGTKKKNLRLPSQYEYLPVEFLGDGAFSYCQYLENVYLPETIKEIGKDCFQGINPMRKIVFEEKETNFSPILYMKNTQGNSFLFGIVSWDTFMSILPETHFMEEPTKKIAFANNGVIVVEGQELIRVDLITREEKRLEMQEDVAKRLIETMMEAGANNQKYLEESRWLTFFWKEIKRYNTEMKDAILNLDYILNGVDDSLGAKESEGQVCFWIEEKPASILDILVFAGEKQTGNLE